MDMIDIAVAKAFATKVAAGFSNVEVDGMTIIFTLNDGQTVSLTVPTPADGVSVTDIDIDANGDLICTMSNGTEINAGRVLPQKGVDYWTEEDKQEILDETNAKYNELLDQIPSGTEENTAINLSDSSNLAFKEVQLRGNTSQTTTSISSGDEYDSPTPDHSQPISVVTGDNTINIVGKNLLDLTKRTNTNNTTSTWENNILTVTSTFGSYKGIKVNVTDLIKSNAGKTIYWNCESYSLDGGRYAVTLEIRDSAGNVSYPSIATNNSYNIPNDTSNLTSVILTIFQNNSGSTRAGTLTVVKPMLEFVNDNIYEPYTEQTQLISLGNIELAKIGDYQDRIYKENGKWWLEKQILKVVCNGTESWTVSDSGTDKWYLKGAGNILPPLLATETTLCNLYPYARGNINNSNSRIGIALTKISTTNGQIRIRYGTEPTAENFKTFLASNNLIAYGVLETSIKTEISNTTLILQLENWLKMKTYKNITNMFTITDNQIPTLDITYRKDLETLFNNISQE